MITAYVHLHSTHNLFPVPILLTLFWTFLKINLLSTSGSASTGLLYNEAVGHFLTENQFVQAVGLATLLPGSDALQLAMFVGYTVAGIPGGFVSLFAAILPPTVIMLGVVMLLHRIQREAWVSRFVEGLTPAVAILILTVAWKIFIGKRRRCHWLAIPCTWWRGSDRIVVGSALLHLYFWLAESRGRFYSNEYAAPSK